ncbi:type II secretion system protein [Thermocrinis sp.]|jgi:type II secretory pathway pseudopilin PulG|uniref:type II secretion system protein n=1 Tax=Thermocrinis sp. TaxID=2024383 RepID=UPI0026175878|nr:type II secretion system protein [Thermocrinis sp.]
MNKKGFTIIELLIAFVILFILMAGFLRGILLYMDYQINNGLKDRASEIALKMSSQIQTAKLDTNATYCSPNSTNPFLCDARYTYPYNWGSARCDGGNCTFEVQDSDNDGIADFYDPYNGLNGNFKTNPINTAGWLRIRPCNCDGSRCICCYADGTPINNVTFACGERYRGRFIYAGTTLAKLINPATNLEVGRVAGVIVWYFDTKGRYKYISLPVMRDTR